MNRKNLMPTLAAPVDRTALRASFTTDVIDSDQDIHPSKYHVKDVPMAHLARTMFSGVSTPQIIDPTILLKAAILDLLSDDGF